MKEIHGITMLRIEGLKRIGIDSMFFIYLLEDHPDFSDIVSSILKDVESGEMTGVTSVITLLEILVKPKMDYNVSAVDDYKNVLSNFPNLEIVPVDNKIADIASTLRADYGIKTPDAIQVATSIKEGCSAFLTNDFALKKIKEIRVITLRDII
ncbi:MAG: PIN domain protein [Methanomethylovorans sp. PtaU1.Bin073]|jgi:predicted nucleic acid-binding protein|nr:MAG: PIN domain protein [Methanomethylovorans sp. PtaU1.Bin073]